MQYHLYVDSNRNDTKELIYKTKRDPQLRKQTWLPKGTGGGRDGFAVWD